MWVPFIFTFGLLPFFALAQIGGNGVGNGPSVIPLAVKTPYLNAWADATMLQWPRLWDMKDENVLGWVGFARVDGVTYQWMGQFPDIVPANLSSTVLTPSRTILTFDAGPVILNVTYLSPIETSDLALQSLPFSYMAVDVISRDGAPHNVQLYSDTSGEWASSSNTAIAQWSTQVTSNTVTQKISPAATKNKLAETRDMVDDGTFYYAMPANTKGLTWQTGADTTLRPGFNATGRLNNADDTNFRAIDDKWPVLAISVDLGSIVNSTAPTVWSLGLVRNSVIQFTTPSGSVQQRSPFYFSKFNTIDSIISMVTGRYAEALQKAISFDESLLSRASSISEEYSDLISLTTRATLASLEMTVLKRDDGSYDTRDLKFFMRDTGANNAQGVRTNPVDSMFSSWPLWMDLNPEWGKYLLEPLFEVQTNTADQGSAIGDLGQTFPTASKPDMVSTGQNVFGVENSASMIIMALAHAQASGDGSMLSSQYGTLKGWATNIVANATRSDQRSTDSRIIPSQGSQDSPNLVLRAILGIKAMSKISEVASKDQDKATFSNSADAMLQQWMTTSSGADQMFYPLFIDQLLGLKMISDQVYQQQENRVTGSLNPFGPTLSSASSGMTRADWVFFTAATMRDNSKRSNLIATVSKAAKVSSNKTPFSVLYNTNTGAAGSQGQISPAFGAVFAPLRLGGQVKDFSVSVPRPVNFPVIVGGVIGGILLLALIVVASWFFWRRHQRRAQLAVPGVAPSSRHSFISQAFTASEGGTGTFMTSSSSTISSSSSGVVPYSKDILAGHTLTSFFSEKRRGPNGFPEGDLAFPQPAAGQRREDIYDPPPMYALTSVENQV